MHVYVNLLVEGLKCSKTLHYLSNNSPSQKGWFMAFSFRMQARWKSYTHDNVSLKLGMRQNSLGFNFYCKIKLSYKEFKICIDIHRYLHLEFWYQSNKKQQFHYLLFPGNMDAGESGDHNSHRSPRVFI